MDTSISFSESDTVPVVSCADTYSSPALTWTQSTVCTLTIQTIVLLFIHRTSSPYIEQTILCLCWWSLNQNLWQEPFSHLVSQDLFIYIKWSNISQILVTVKSSSVGRRWRKTITHPRNEHVLPGAAWVAPSFFLPSVPTVLELMWVTPALLCEFNQRTACSSGKQTPLLLRSAILFSATFSLRKESASTSAALVGSELCSSFSEVGQVISPHISPVSHTYQAPSPGRPKLLSELWLHLGIKRARGDEGTCCKGAGICRVCSLWVMTSGSSTAAFNGHLSDTVY